MAGIVDCSDFCRLCLVKEQVNNPIFEDDGRNRQVHTKISTCLPVKVTWEDALPKRICDGCNYKLDQQFQFWSTSVNSEKQLKQWLGIVDEEEPKPAVKTKKEKLETSASKRPRRNARRKAVQNIRQAVAAQQQSDSDDGEPLASLVDRDSDFDYNDTITKEETNSENDFPSNNTDSVEPTTFVNVTLDNEIGQAGPSGIQKPSVADTGETEAPEGYKFLSVIKTEEDTLNITAESKIDENKTEPNILYKCPDCPKMFTQNSKLKVHRVSHSNERPFECSTCNKRFKHKTSLNIHLKGHESVEGFECDICQHTFSQKYYLKYHKKKHFKQYTFFCDSCGKGCYSQSELESHMKDKHASGKHICKLCNEECPTKHFYRKHILTHRPAKPQVSSHVCEFCNQSFSQRSVWREHVKRKHMGVRRCVCDICGKEVSSTTTLNNHMRIHSGERPMICNTCGKAFNSKQSLRTHSRTHTGEKPYQCSECGKRFTQRSTLTVHKRYHTGERPFVCDYCENSYVTKTLLREHKKKRHAVIEPATVSLI